MEGKDRAIELRTEQSRDYDLICLKLRPNRTGHLHNVCKRTANILFTIKVAILSILLVKEDGTINNDNNNTAQNWLA